MRDVLVYNKCRKLPDLEVGDPICLGCGNPIFGTLAGFEEAWRGFGKMCAGQHEFGTIYCCFADLPCGTTIALAIHTVQQYLLTLSPQDRLEFIVCGHVSERDFWRLGMSFPCEECVVRLFRWWRPVKSLEETETCDLVPEILRNGVPGPNNPHFVELFKR